MAVASTSGPVSGAYAYDANGNMSSKAGETLGWTSYNYLASVTKAGESSTFAYAPDRKRYRQISTYAGVTVTTHYQVGGLVEKVAKSSGETEFRHLIHAGGRVVAQHTRKHTGATENRYFHRDYLGSVETVTNESGVSVGKMSFDAFGARRDATTWSGWFTWPGSSSAINAARTATSHGYTGHEMLDSVGLVHMNGRVYDPYLGRFASADPYVPRPFNSQAFNRFSYVGNNPLRFVDPSGFCDSDSLEVNTSADGGGGGSDCPTPPPPTTPQGPTCQAACEPLQGDGGECVIVCSGGTLPPPPSIQEILQGLPAGGATLNTNFNGNSLGTGLGIPGSLSGLPSGPSSGGGGGGGGGSGVPRGPGSPGGTPISGPNGNVPPGGQLGSPLVGNWRVSSNFGWRGDPLNPMNREFHPGVDYLTPIGTPFVAPHPGDIVFAGNLSRGGWTIVIQGNGQFSNFRSTFHHLSSLTVSVNQTVDMGQALGLTGNSGLNTTGPHLHWSLRDVARGCLVDPLDPSGPLETGCR